MKKRFRVWSIIIGMIACLGTWLLLAGCSLPFQWTEIGTASFQNGWTNAGGAFETAAYGKDNLGFVHLKGYVSDTSYAQYAYMFTLPAGCRPNNTLVFNVYLGTVNGSGYVWIYNDGGVALNVPGLAAGTNVAASLNGIDFFAEQ